MITTVGFRTGCCLVVVLACHVQAPAQYSFTTLATFNGSNGDKPQDPLFRDSAGNIYGTTAFGGAGGQGTLFRIAAGTNQLTTLVTFGGENGNIPIGGLTQAASGSLYGQTYSGGTNFGGTLFRFDPDPGTFTTLENFTTVGRHPVAPMRLDAGGTLYGQTEGGSIFTYATGTGTLSGFAVGGGAYPLGALLPDSAGNLYGTSLYGGTNGWGTVFRVAADTRQTTILVSFVGDNGAGPWGGLVKDAAGNLYGTTSGTGGESNVTDGTVFKIDATTFALTTLASFNGANGTAPMGTILLGPDGFLYGTTTGGGLHGNGTIFRVSAATGELTTLFNFDGANGDYPATGLIMDDFGNLYGTTAFGGPDGKGTVFVLSPVPEPTGLLAAGVVSVMLGGRRWFRRAPASSGGSGDQ